MRLCFDHRSPARTRRLVLVLALGSIGIAGALVGGAIAGPAAAATPRAASLAPAAESSRIASRLALGDSVMLGAASRLRHRGYSVNAVESRQVYDGIDVLRRLHTQGRLPGLLVVGLGTNGTFSRSECRQIHTVAGPARHVYLVTVRAPRSWTPGNNRVIHRCAAKYANTSLIDWARASRPHPGWFYSDGIHLTPAGARGYTRVVNRSVG